MGGTRQGEKRTKKEQPQEEEDEETTWTAADMQAAVDE